ncbi:MAG: reactive intermediate/imine deaminase [Bdellovibrionales bacterium CG10_big_fil_rev_8_21_14_0_10_45_34]|nr:MAG: reactive intermediate/imine deaminase [Bdellovibrionales bacterium CG10_big_fil_rev_8_21_14_0_10_45_34]
MEKRIVTTSNAPKPVGPYSQAVECGGILYCSGQIGLNPETNSLVEGGVSEHTVQIMKNVEAVLKEAGLGFGNVIKTTIFLKDMADFKFVNEIYGSYFKAAPPARSTVQVAGLPLGVPVEIEVLAAR